MSAESQQSQSKKGKVQVGDRAPTFSLPTQTGATVSPDDFLGKSAVVLYFYPKDNSAGCIAEACSFRDSYEDFKAAGAEVIGVSADSEASHQQFASKHRLPFLLLSDTQGVLRKRYGVSAVMGILPGRVTFVIDKEGIVRHIFSDSMHMQRHMTEALKIVQSIAQQ
jgi:thioredoxin-dependent peroxiredoxin